MLKRLWMPGWKERIYCFLILFLVFPSLACAQGLDLGEEDVQAVAEVGPQYPNARLALLLFSVYLVLAVGLLGFLIFKKKKAWKPPIKLRDLPDSAKVIGTLAILSYVLVHLFALLTVFLKMRVAGTVEEYFFYMGLEKLAGISHAHFFGHATMYALTSAVFLLTSVSERWKVVFISLALGSGLLDVPSWWMMKYAGPRFEAFSMVAGMMGMVGWGFMTVRILYELWFQRGKGDSHE